MSNQHPLRRSRVPRPADPERIMNRYVLPPMFTAAALCVAMMCLAIVDGVWIASVLAVPTILLAHTAAQCHRLPPVERRR